MIPTFLYGGDDCFITPTSTQERTRRLQDKIALITGDGSGIGEATAKTFAREGATVVVADIDDTNGQRVVVVEEIRRAGGRADYTHADIGEPAQIERMISFTTGRFGRLDVLHNNALFTVIGRIGDLTLEGWKKTLDVSLTGY